MAQETSASPGDSGEPWVPWGEEPTSPSRDPDFSPQGDSHASRVLTLAFQPFDKNVPRNLLWGNGSPEDLADCLFHKV